MERDKIKGLIAEVLATGFLMSLATRDEGGLWVADVIFVHDDELNLYWMSDPDSRHSKAIAGGGNVAGTITASGQGEDNLGIQFAGVAERIVGARFDLATKHFTKRKKTPPKESDDVLQGDSWYVLRPKTVELIHEKLFGFEKRTLAL